MQWRVTVRDVAAGREFVDFVTADTRSEARKKAASLWGYTGWVVVQPCHKTVITNLPAVSQEIALPLGR